eukprot:scaffold117466_cov16-Tisochrysis_lutea.AAC.1
MRQMYLSIQWRAGHQIKGAVSHQCGKCIVHTMACWASDQSDISFVFRTESGVRAPGGFQCRLVDEEAVANDEDGEVLVDEGTVANDKDGEFILPHFEMPMSSKRRCLHFMPLPMLPPVHVSVAVNYIMFHGPLFQCRHL